jgi:hypothetical protein
MLAGPVQCAGLMAIGSGPPARAMAGAGAKAMPANVEGASTPKFSNAKRNLSARDNSVGLRREANRISARDRFRFGRERAQELGPRLGPACSSSKLS